MTSDDGAEVVGTVVVVVGTVVVVVGTVVVVVGSVVVVVGTVVVVVGTVVVVVGSVVVVVGSVVVVVGSVSSLSALWSLSWALWSSSSAPWSSSWALWSSSSALWSSLSAPWSSSSALWSSSSAPWSSLSLRGRRRRHCGRRRRHRGRRCCCRCHRGYRVRTSRRSSPDRIDRRDAEGIRDAVGKAFHRVTGDVGQIDPRTSRERDDVAGDRASAIRTWRVSMSVRLRRCPPSRSRAWASLAQSRELVGSNREHSTVTYRSRWATRRRRLPRSPPAQT